jgi:glycosyltransferase involved in cell wall biosynthesis
MPEISPRVTVIIPTYDRLEMLKRAVGSVLRQSYLHYELLIVDDGSTDGTGSEFAAASSPLRYIYQEHQGVSQARNRGIAEAKGELIAFLDSDDLWNRDKLSLQVQYFRDHPEAVICQTQEIWIRNDVRVNPKKKHKKPSGWIFPQCLPLCVVSPSAVMMRKSLFDDVGLFDESLRICEDYDMWLRVALCYPVHLIDKPLVTKYGGHADQLSHSDWAVDRYRVRALEKALSDPLAASFRPQIIEEIHRKSTIIANGALKRGRLMTWLRYFRKRRMKQ